MSRSVLVRNLRTGEEQTFSCAPQEAVVAAFAQERGDFNTWEYRERYAGVVVFNQATVSAGEWSARL